MHQLFASNSSKHSEPESAAPTHLLLPHGVTQKKDSSPAPTEGLPRCILDSVKNLQQLIVAEVRWRGSSNPERSSQLDISNFASWESAGNRLDHAAVGNAGCQAL